MAGDSRDRDQLRRWVENWTRVGPVLEEIRASELATIDTVAVLAGLEDAFEDALGGGSRPASGLVDLQRYLQRLSA